MTKILWLSMFFLAQTSWAGGSSSMPVSLVKPRFLTFLDKVPMSSAAAPTPPPQDPQGRAIDGKEAILPPPTATMDLFSDPALFVTIKRDKKTERDVRHFYWHRSMGPDYCHYRSLEGDHWYGWMENGFFYYILWRGNRFWWRDPVAGHWLYYFRGVWWSSDGQEHGTLQACVDGEYFLCDRTGKVLKDMGPEGKGSIVSPSGLTYRADLWRQKRAERRAQGEKSRGNGEEDRAHGQERPGSADLSLESKAP